MRKLHFVVYLLLIIGVSTNVYSRRGGGSSFRSSSSRRSSYSAPKRTTVKKTTPRKSTPTRAKKSSTIKKKSTTSKKTATKPKAVSTSKISKKKAKAYASQNKAAAKKYGTKKKAESAYREKLASKNKYNSPTPPSTRPDYVPQSVTINNTHVNTSYGMLPGGYYGYGYMDPITHTMVALAAHHMMVDDMRMMQAGYGQWDSTGRPIIYRSSTGAIVIGVIVLLVIIGVIIAISFS
jgi:hypothetical protein